MAETVVGVYSVPEVAEKIGITKVEAYQLLDEGKFPFPVLRIGPRRWLVPKKSVNRFIDQGKGLRTVDPGKPVRTGSPPRLNSANSVTHKVCVSLEMERKFNYVCNNINSTLMVQAGKGDFLRIAVQEFIDRRPEHLKGYDDVDPDCGMVFFGTGWKVKDK